MDVSHDGRVRDEARAGPGGGHAERVHGLGAEELAQARAEHLAAVGRARVGRAAGALELYLPAATRAGEHLAQVDGRAVAQLTRERAELVAAVAMGRPLAARHHTLAAQVLGCLFSLRNETNKNKQINFTPLISTQNHLKYQLNCAFL